MYGHIQDGSELRELINAKLGSGRLPPDSHTRVFAGSGDGQPCACCEQPIRYSSIQYDVEDAASARFAAMHRICFQIWRELADRVRPAAIQSDQEEGASDSGIMQASEHEH